MGLTGGRAVYLARTSTYQLLISNTGLIYHRTYNILTPGLYIRLHSDQDRTIKTPLNVPRLSVPRPTRALGDYNKYIRDMSTILSLSDVIHHPHVCRLARAVGRIVARYAGWDVAAWNATRAYTD